jgi:polyphosphate kinase 2 (PPK2 family)
MKHRDLKAAIIFGARDAAGKGGVIKRITERVSCGCFA